MSFASHPSSSASRSSPSADSAATAASASLRLVSWRPNLEAINARLHSSVGNNNCRGEEKEEEEEEEASGAPRGLDDGASLPSPPLPPWEAWLTLPHASMARAYASRAVACCPDCAAWDGESAREKEK